MLNDQYYGLRHDVWGMGILAFFLFSGKFPFDGKTEVEICEKVKNKDPNWEIMRDRRIDSKVILLVRGMLEKDKNKRLTIKQVMADRLFRFLREMDANVRIIRNQRSYLLEKFPFLI